MKISEGYMIREIAGNHVAIPVGQSVIDYKGMLHLNETGAFILNQLKDEISYEELFNKMKEEYEFEEGELDTLKADLDAFLKKVAQIGVITE